jgi:hypothetical protein
LSDPLQCDEETALDLRPHPSLAQELVAGLADLPKGDSRSQSECSRTSLRSGWDGFLLEEETIPFLECTWFRAAWWAVFGALACQFFQDLGSIAH